MVSWRISCGSPFCEFVWRYFHACPIIAFSPLIASFSSAGYRSQSAKLSSPTCSPITYLGQRLSKKSSARIFSRRSQRLQKGLPFTRVYHDTNFIKQYPPHLHFLITFFTPQVLVPSVAFCHPYRGPSHPLHPSCADWVAREGARRLGCYLPCRVGVCFYGCLVSPLNACRHSGFYQGAISCSRYETLSLSCTFWVSHSCRHRLCWILGSWCFRIEYFLDNFKLKTFSKQLMPSVI